MANSNATNVKRQIRLHCDSCEPLAINGCGCHETGCPNSHIDLATGRPHPQPCWQCGYDFYPEERVSRFAVCPDCCEEPN